MTTSLSASTFRAMLGDIETFTDAEKLARLRLTRTDGIGPVTFKKLLSTHGNAITALDSLLDSGKKIPEPAALEKEIETTGRYGAEFIFLGAPDYPALLAEIPDAPPVLIIKGNANYLHRQSVGIVGARNASASGIKLTHMISAKLSEAGIVIISGLARGIDTAAHQSASHYVTVACLAGGLDYIYPPENAALHKALSQEGLLVSEMPLGTEPQARHFPRRNRLISGLSEGVLIVEAAEKSGSLITARYAADQGRDVFAIPGSPLDPRARGTNRLIRDGAILVQSAEDIINELSSLRETQKPKPVPHHSPTAVTLEKAPQKNIQPSEFIGYLGPTPVHIDDLVRLSGSSTEAVLSMLLPLEIQGEIVRHSGNQFSRNSIKIE